MKFLPLIRTVCAWVAVVLGVAAPDSASAQYYYPQYPGYYPQQPQYPQYPQQRRHPQQPQHPQYPQQREQPQHRQQPRQESSQTPTPGAQPRKTRTVKDSSGDTPPSVDVSALINGPMETYTWHHTDTFSHLARAAGVTTNEILALNNLSFSQLRNGQVLRVPTLTKTSPTLDIVRDPDAQRAREIWRGVRGKNQVALTFDAGGVSTGLNTLLKNLKEKDAAATFFATGEYVKKNPNDTQSIVDAGYPIYNHSWSHPEFTSLSDEEIVSQLSRTDDAVSSITGVSTKPYWRPPFGNRDSRVLKTAARAGYVSIYWTHDSHDSVGEKKSADFVADRVLNPPNAKANPDGYLDGGIILMHVGEEGTANAIPRIVDSLRARGFTLVTLDEILRP